MVSRTMYAELWNCVSGNSKRAQKGRISSENLLRVSVMLPAIIYVAMAKEHLSSCLLCFTTTTKRILKVDVGLKTLHALAPPSLQSRSFMTYPAYFHNALVIGVASLLDASHCATLPHGRASIELGRNPNVKKIRRCLSSFGIPLEAFSKREKEDSAP